MPTTEADYKKQYSDTVRLHVAMWETLLDEKHPKRNCVPIIQEIGDRILAEINTFHLKAGEAAPPGYIGAKLNKLALYAETCLLTEHELPQNPSVAIEDLERQMIVRNAATVATVRVLHWEKRFEQAGAKSSGCAPLVEGKARKLMNQLKQLDDLHPQALQQAQRTGMVYLDAYAARCLHKGAAAMRQLDLPKPYDSPQVSIPK